MTVALLTCRLIQHACEQWRCSWPSYYACTDFLHLTFFEPWNSLDMNGFVLIFFWSIFFFSVYSLMYSDLLADTFPYHSKVQRRWIVEVWGNLLPPLSNRRNLKSWGAQLFLKCLTFIFAECNQKADGESTRGKVAGSCSSHKVVLNSWTVTQHGTPLSFNREGLN